MIKCFLSHSSKDKKSYVEIVARRLGFEHCVYDEYSFEEGMRPIDEILKGLNTSQLFVAFISGSSLESEWVQKELFEAKERLENSELERVFPILIDGDIAYKDPRIPDWLREQYNLKIISRPSVAARRIEQRL